MRPVSQRPVCEAHFGGASDHSRGAAGTGDVRASHYQTNELHVALIADEMRALVS